MRLLSFAGILFLGCSVVSTQAGGHDCCHHGHNYGDCRRTGGAAAFTAPAPNLQSFEGKVAEVVYLPGATPESALVELRLQTGAGVQLVRLSPAGFLKNGGLIVREGDTVAVKGFPVAGMEGDIIVASEIHKGDKTLLLRDARGLPAW